jgi:hypothetical protein
LTFRAKSPNDIIPPESRNTAENITINSNRYIETTPSKATATSPLMKHTRNYEQSTYLLLQIPNGAGENADASAISRRENKILTCIMVTSIARCSCK